MRWCDGSLSRILSLFICSLGGADGNRTHVLKVTELHSLVDQLFGSKLFIMLGIKEPCSSPCTSIPRILGLRTSHESSSPFLCMGFLSTPTLTHNILTSESIKGALHLASCHEHFANSAQHLSVSECLGFILLYQLYFFSIVKWAKKPASAFRLGKTRPRSFLF